MNNARKEEIFLIIMNAWSFPGKYKFRKYVTEIHSFRPFLAKVQSVLGKEDIKVEFFFIRTMK